MRRSLIAALYALAALSATLAQERPKDTFESLWNDATAAFHKTTEYDAYTMVEAGNAFYYFTKPGHYAHPGVVRRVLTERGGRFHIDTEGWSFAEKAGQPGFQKWLGEFKELNSRVMEYLEQQQR